MMKNKIIILVALVLAACASKEVPPANMTDSQDGMSLPDQPMVTQAPSGGSSGPTPTTVPAVVTPTAKSNLLDAIRSGHDETIYRTATQVLSQNPSEVVALNALGIYHYRRGQHLAAQYMFAKAMKLTPNSSELHSNIGLVHLALKERRRAIKSFRKALELNPEDGVAAANVGALYVEDRDFLKAVVPLEIASKKLTKDARVLNNYAAALANTGKQEQAKGLYTEALRLNPNSKEILFNYCVLLVDHLKKPQEAMEYINKLKFLGPAQDMRNRMNALENRAKAGLK